CFSVLTCAPKSGAGKFLKPSEINNIPAAIEHKSEASIGNFVLKSGDHARKFTEEISLLLGSGFGARNHLNVNGIQSFHEEIEIEWNRTINSEMPKQVLLSILFKVRSLCLIDFASHNHGLV